MKRGFTLIELLLIIAIIGVVMAIAISSAKKARELEEGFDGKASSIEKCGKERGRCRYNCAYSDLEEVDIFEVCLEKCEIREEWCLVK